MCMSIDPNVVPLFNDEGWGTFYKFVEAEDNCSPYYKTKYAPGVIVSDRVDRGLTAKEAVARYVDPGIHIILTLDSIRRLLKSVRYVEDMRIIKILAHQDHLVSTGYWCAEKAAVFTQVTVPDDFELEVIEGFEEEEEDDDLEDEWDDIEDEEDSWDDEEEDL